MELPAPPPAVLVAVALVALLAAFTFSKLKTYENLPPGPPKTWLGVTPFDVKRYPYRLFKETEIYGPLITVRPSPFQPPTIYVTSAAAAYELLDRRGATSSDRASNYVAATVLTGGMGLLFARYGDNFRKLRKAVHQALMPKQAEAYGPLSERAARNMLRDILRDPSDFRAHFHSYAASVVQSLSFGKRTKSSFRDPGLQLALAWNMALVGAVTPGHWAVERFPFLKYLPGYLDAPKKAHRVQLDDYRAMTKQVQKEMAEGTAPPSFAKYLLEEQKQYGLTFDEIAWLAGGLYHAGSDTTAISINYGLRAAASHPEAQRRVAEEIAAVVGPERSPSFDDMDDLPYLAAFVKESLRWRGATPGGIPHRMIADEQFMGYTIPKDALLVPVAYCCNNDPDLFPKGDAGEFKPERWLEKDNNLPDPKYFAWGFGRRICPGMHIAERSIFINLAHLIWAFEVSPGIDPSTGKPTVLSHGPEAYNDVGISAPHPWPVVFKSRFQGLQARLGEDELLIDE